MTQTVESMTVEQLVKTAYVLGEVVSERKRQDAKWGEQNHGVIGDHKDVQEDIRLSYAGWEQVYQQINRDRDDQDTMGWDSILLEEVYEALSETDRAKRRKELIEVAAVAVAMVECMDREDERDGQATEG